MHSKPIERVWINPPKYWAATKDMSPEQVERLLDEIVSLAQAGDHDALRRIEFLSLEIPMNKSSAA